MLACTATWRGSDTRLLRFMSENSKDIYELDKDFRRSYPPAYSANTEGSVYICNFAEMRSEEQFGIIVGPTVRMFPGASGYPRNRWLDADHRGMNKFCAADDPNLQIILEELRAIFTALRVEKSVIVASRPVETVIVRSSLGIPVTSHFVGREYLLERIHNLLGMTTQPSFLEIVSIYGAAGMGKTQAAMAYSQDFGENFGAILEIDGTSYVTCCASFKRVRILLAKDDPIIKQDYQEWEWARGNVTLQNEIKSECMINYGLVRDWLLRQKDMSWLLVFDNVDDLETFDIRDFFPYDVPGRVLVTSRRPESCEWSQWRCLKVSELHRDESRSLFLKRLSIELEPESRVMVLLDKLLDRLGDMPLAIAQASAYISRRLLIFRGTQHKILRKLEEELTAYETAFMEQLQKQSVIGLRDYHNDSILTTWEISFQAIESQDWAAAELLQLMGFLNRRDLNPKLLRYAVLPSQSTGGFFRLLRKPRRWMRPPEVKLSDAHLDAYFNLYISYSLLDYLEDLDTFSMHPMIHTWVRLRLSRPMQLYYAIQAMRLVEAGWVLQLQPIAHTENVFESLTGYFSTATTGENELHLNPWALQERVWPDWFETFVQKLMLVWGVLDDAIFSLKKLLMPPDSRLVVVPWRYAYTLGDRVDHLGLIKWSYQEACSRLHYRHPFALKVAGSYANALLLDSEVLPGFIGPWFAWLTNIRASTYGYEHPSTAGAILGTARLFLADGRYEEADRFFSEAFRIRVKMLGVEDVLTRYAIEWKMAILARKADRHAALSFVKELYELDRLSDILEDGVLSKVLGVVFYQNFGFNSTLFELFERRHDNYAELKSALIDFRWTDLVPEALNVTCDFSRPGWCSCLHAWDGLLGSKWTQHPSPCDSPGHENETWGPYGWCIGVENDTRPLFEKCDVWIKYELGDDASKKGAEILLMLLQDLTNHSHRVEHFTHSSRFDNWAWVPRIGFHTALRLLYYSECELAEETTNKLSQLTRPDEPGLVFLLAQSYACQGAVEKACSLYQAAEAAINTAKVTCDTFYSHDDAGTCWLSVVYWAQGICQWLGGNFTRGQEHILHALEAGQLLYSELEWMFRSSHPPPATDQIYFSEVEWMLYDLRMAREYFNISDDDLYVLTVRVKLEDGYTQFIHSETRSPDSGRKAWATIYDELLDAYGPETAHDWADCFDIGTDDFPDSCASFNYIRTYSTRDTGERRIPGYVEQDAESWWTDILCWARLPHLHGETTLRGSAYSRTWPPGELGQGPGSTQYVQQWND